MDFTCGLWRIATVVMFFWISGTHCLVVYKTVYANEYEFKIYTAQKTFDDAKSYCEKSGSNLAISDTQNIKVAISNAIRNIIGFSLTDYWIGATNRENHDVWKWLNGEVVDDNGWNTNEPNNRETEHCAVVLRHNGRWNNIACSKKKAFICQKASSIKVSTTSIVVGDDEPDEITCTADGYPNPRSPWTFDGNQVSSDQAESVYQTTNHDEAILHISSATLLNEGVYKCWANNAGGSIRSGVYEMTAIKVPSHPSDLTVENLCNSSMTIISWRPSPRAVNLPHRVVIRNSNGDISPLYTDNEKDPFATRRVIEHLEPWQYYNVSVFPCVSLTSCKTEYSVSKMALTAGIPSEVTSISVLASDASSCRVTWSLPELVSKNAFTGHEISITEEFAENLRDMKTMSNITVESADTTFKYSGKPNRKYSFGVQAKTCAGLGPIAWSRESCITKKQVPYIVPNMAIQGSVDGVGQISVSVQMPSQENGSISCLFVIVKPVVKSKISDGQKTHTMENLRKANSSILAKKIDDEYIAVSLVTSGLSAEKTYVVLGDKSVTECDIASSKARNKRSISGNSTFVGRNIKLDSHKDYSIYIVSTTPTVDGVLFQQSTIQPLRDTGEGGTGGNSEHQASNAGMIVGVLVGCILLLLMVLGLIYIRRRQAGTAKGPERILENDQPTPSPQPQRQEETVVYQNAVVDEVRSETIIKMKEFESTYRNLLVNDGAKFAEQFENLTREALGRKGTTEIASKPELKKKNRYKNILPYDVSRVIIKNNGSGYINACFIDGFNEKNKFIASQGPLPSTVVDFWLMIVEQKCSVIVMLAKCIEAGKKKCEKYWPDLKDTAHFGPVTVSNKEEVRFCGFVRRRLAVTAKLKDQTIEMTVSQYHFLTWPDHGVPPTTSQLIRMYKEAMQTHQNQGGSTPIVVHCSAGAGRSGTFVAYDTLLNQSKKMKSADPYNCVLKMRDQRVEMVQNCDQYILVQKLILESFLFGDTDQTSTQAMGKFTDVDYRMKVAVEQFENLSRVEPMKITLNSTNIKISPYHRMRVVIADMDGNSHQSTIDASFVESYDESSRLIASEPLSSANVESFWRVVLDNSVSVIVTLESKPETENKYWPAEIGTSNKFGELSVKLDGGESANDFDKRTLTVKGFGRAVALTHIQLLGGPNRSCPMDGRQLIKLADELQKALRESKSSVALIHSRDGSESTGTFCAIVNLIERLKVENRVDVFRGVKDLRDCRRGMVQTLDQYILCHQVVIDYLNSFEVYSNFR